MKCTNCEMVNQLPGTNCSHCGRPIPELKPTTLTEAEDQADAGETEETTESSTESGQAETTEETESPPEAGSGAEDGEGQGPETDPAQAEKVVPENGHVDNVGDDSETETVLP